MVFLIIFSCIFFATLKKRAFYYGNFYPDPGKPCPLKAKTGSLPAPVFL
ncbi:hypothetical protein TREAZ_1276 [Leadbettera azotonutricia ZAS-9]|uniref:Uncharacterized protein n=1 Tax=Leadbettera azotonutricia (strain ATCC BAA-888 / DSM 13862 / ZAS-9) TaxID=545695 RepID=F5YG28_LEAAZ|nr:hypothetical protein TREAZ_1276 [Leadbettera azotonutricia ZAS-9]